MYLGTIKPLCVIQVVSDSLCVRRADCLGAPRGRDGAAMPLLGLRLRLRLGLGRRWARLQSSSGSNPSLLNQLALTQSDRGCFIGFAFYGLRFQPGQNIMRGHQLFHHRSLLLLLLFFSVRPHRRHICSLACSCSLLVCENCWSDYTCFECKPPSGFFSFPATLIRTC